MDRKEYLKQYHKKYKEKYRPIRNKRRREKRDYILQYKKLHGCSVCGKSDHWILEFHHVRGEKKYAVTQAVEYGFETLIREIKKCIVVCANCHRTIHWHWKEKEKLNDKR